MTTVNEEIRQLKNTVIVNEGNASASAFNDASISSGDTAIIQALLAINANFTLHNIYLEDIAACLVAMVPA